MLLIGYTTGTFNTRMEVPEFGIFDIEIVYYKSKCEVEVSQILFSIHNRGSVDAHNVEVECYRLYSPFFRSSSIVNRSIGHPLQIGTIQANEIRSIRFFTFPDAPSPICSWIFDDGVFTTDKVEIMIRVEVRCDQLDPESFAFSSTIEV